VTPAPATNAFHISLGGTKAVRLDLGRMEIAASNPITGTVWTNDGALDLRLDGGWVSAPDVLVDGEPATSHLEGGVLDIAVPAGEHSLTITPGSGEGLATAVDFTDDSARSAQYSDVAAIEARLTEASGAPLSGQDLSFTLGSSSATAVTDESGIARVELPVTETPGDRTVSVAFAGRDAELMPALASASFSVERDDSSTTLTSSGGKRPLTAALVDADSFAPLGGRTIQFTANGEGVGSAVTNEDGVASMEAPKRYRGKGVVFTATFAADGFYLQSSDSNED
jgi:hypothetical protein